MAGARQQFFEHMRSAPYAAHQFVQAIHGRYDPRNDVRIHYTFTKKADLRLEVVWDMANGQQDQQNFATFNWQSRNKVFYCEIFVSPPELAELGFDDAKEHKHGPLLSQVRVGADYWDDCERRAAFFRTLDLACVRITSKNEILQKKPRGSLED